MAIGVVVGEQHLGHAIELGGLGRGGVAALTRDQHMHLAQAI